MGTATQKIVTDSETGEVLFEQYYTQRSQNGKDWCIVYQMTAYLLATDHSFSVSDIRTYLYIVANADYDCKFASGITDMANKIGITRQQLHASIKTLKEKDLIRVSSLHGIRYFFLNPYYTTRGRERSKLRTAYESIPKDVQKRLNIQAQAEEIAQSF